LFREKRLAFQLGTHNIKEDDREGDGVTGPDIDAVPLHGDKIGKAGKIDH
jgi:hypothetical protein